jgi:hypothetical protein
VVKGQGHPGDLASVHLSRSMRRLIQAFGGADRDEEIKYTMPAMSTQVNARRP